MLNSCSHISNEPLCELATNTLKGTLLTSALAGIIEYQKIQKGETTINQAISNSLRVGLKGGALYAGSMFALNKLNVNPSVKSLALPVVSAGVIYLNNRQEAIKAMQEQLVKTNSDLNRDTEEV